VLQELGVALWDRVRLDEHSLFPLIEETVSPVTLERLAAKLSHADVWEEDAGQASLCFFIVWLCKTIVVIDLPMIADPDDALSQPTRARLFALLSDLKGPAGTPELAERLELHPNGVRLHLERLAEEGLVERAHVRQRRGRPPDAWTIAPQAQPGGRAPHAYRDLGRWLARALGARPGGLRSVENTGREIGRELAPKDPHRDPDALETTLTALGFQPTIERREGAEVTICLGNCPYRDAVRENQPAICALHRGITGGLLDVLEPRAKLSAFVPRDPDQAGCLIELRGLRPPEAART
jgi:predicted ArsR family transcriptional regulator